MKRVVGALFLLSAVFCGQHALAQGAGSTPPPTAQFPSTEPAPAGTQKAQAPPAAPPPQAPAAPSAAPPPLAAAPPPPPGAAPPVAPNGSPPYPNPPAAYQYAPPELVPIQPPATDSDEVVSITISPLHLIFPILQLTGEVRATPHFGISVVAGYGSVPVDTTNTNSITGTSTVKFTAYEIGGRLIGYPLKRFKSLQLGGQLMYLKVDTNGPLPDSNISGTGAGIAFGPFVGYKLLTSVGFTFLAQLGFQYLSAQAEAHDTSGLSSSASNNRFLPLLNLDIGWSF